MTKHHCPVNGTLEELTLMLSGSSIQHPRSRRLAEEIRDLIADIAWGRAGDTHLPAVDRRLEAWQQQESDLQCAAKAAELASNINTQREVFESHVQTHNCASQVCVKLAPAPCQMACPASIDVPTYISLIGEGKDAEAIEVIRHDNPLPWVCGLICTRPCEFMCVRGRLDTPISIKFLKAFAAERALSEQQYRNPEKAESNGRKVCVVGAGPGGLSAAYYLVRKGYTVRIIEALPMAGGMMMVGIPRFRLPREVIDREVAMIEALGAEFQFNTRFGKDVTLNSLKKEGFEAFFFAIGAHNSFKLGIPGENDYPQVLEAIDFLKNVTLGNRQIPGNKVIVLGGGNVAIDTARTCLRLGCASVTIAYRRTRTQMPADAEEVAQAEEEGVCFAFLTIPLEINGVDRRVSGLKCIKAKMVKQTSSNRKSPVPVKGSEHVIAADAIISAIGQRVEMDCLAQVTDLAWTRRDTIQVNTATMETSVAGIFAAGDAVTGPATVVEAIGGGKRAAFAIDRYLAGIPQPQIPPVPVRRGRIQWPEIPASTKMALKRPQMPLLNMERRRTTFQQVELGYSENMVREEARRCLRCDICRRCSLCVEICRDRMEINALHLGYMDFDRPGPADFRLTEERCIACGACAENCPNDAMRIRDQGDERILTLCGTVLNRQKLIQCTTCGKVIGPAKYLDYIRKRMTSAGQISTPNGVCDDCARKRSAVFSGDNFPV